MKTMKCKQLGGPANCEVEFHANSWEEMKNQSMEHGKEMFQKGDEPHLKSMQEMQQKMQNPEDMQEWMDKKKKEFDSLPENE